MQLANKKRKKTTIVYSTQAEQKIWAVWVFFASVQDSFTKAATFFIIITVISFTQKLILKRKHWKKPLRRRQHLK